MSVVNPFSITYGSRSVGGASSTYQLNGPYVIDKSFETIRLVFDVVVVASSYSDLQDLAEDLENDFRLRDQDLTIDLDGSTWTYTNGEDILNVTAALSKTGDPETDRGYSRAYTCVIEGELPADDTKGLRELEVNVDFEAGRQKIVSMRGVYTAVSLDHNRKTASEQYLLDFDTEASTILLGIDSSATFELVDENYTRDRNDHNCDFTRQYVELLESQSSGQLDDAQIRDHRMVFTDLSQHPGDSAESIYRLRRVEGTYDCAIDIEQTTGMQAVYDDKVKDHIRALFQANFSPQVFAFEDQRVSYDETTKRLSAAITFVYQKEGGDNIVEVAQQLAYRESRTIDYTPVHNDRELAAEADPGFAVLERIASRTVIVLGTETPKRRLGVKAEEGEAGPIVGIEALPTVQKTGWNLISNTSQTTDQYVGDPGEEQIRMTVLTESVIERYHEAPAVRPATTFRA